MKEISFLSLSARRCLAAAVLLFVALLPAIATSRYYYKVEINVEPSGSGTIYINDEAKTTQTGNKRGGNYAETELNLRAEAADGYQFSKWSNDLGTKPSVNVNIRFDSEYSYWPTTYTYTAYFDKQEGLVKAAVAQGEAIRGSAKIDNLNNELGDVVELTATPDYDNGVKFLGWTKDEGTTYITDNPYSLTVSKENKGTYYAHFSSPQEKLYCRIKNIKSGKFLMLYGNTPASTHSRTYSDNTITDGFVFTNSLKLVSEEEAIGNPMTVFLRTGESAGHGLTHVSNLGACGVQYTSLINSSNYPLTISITGTGDEKIARIYTTFEIKQSGTTVYLDSYLRDDGSDWPVMQSIAELNNIDGLDWEVYVLDEETMKGSFGANAKEKYSKIGKENKIKYYTTMYTEFPYKLMDGVKAYYLPIDEEIKVYDEETNTVHFYEITSGKVPSKTAVVLECTNYYDSDNNYYNRLIPIQENVAELHNFLKGFTMLNEVYPEGTGNDKNKFILSKVGEKLGWYYSTANYMTPNKAYIDINDIEDYIQDHQTQARTVKFSFGDEESCEATGLIAPEFADDIDGPLFDLNGRRVTNGDAYGLKKGVYISNGKKIVVK